jgi:putative holliday junction resolvase
MMRFSSVLRIAPLEKQAIGVRSAKVIALLDQDPCHPPPSPVGRILGLDVGDRRIGVAVSDELGLTAQPVLTLVRKNRRQDLGSLARLIRKYGCARVVVGNPLYMSGDVSPQALKAQEFAQALHLQTGVEVTLWDERLSTTEAHRHLDAARRVPSDRRAVIDQVAAVLILQSFLDALSASATAGVAQRLP